MTKINTDEITNFDFYDFHPHLFNFKEEVLNGLSSFPKRLPPKLFYDAKGSDLFEQITNLNEYYIPRIEMKLLIDNIFESNNFLGDNVLLIEPGSGSGKKVRQILDTHKSINAYMPIEISKEFLYDVSLAMAKDYPEISIIPICTDYLSEFSLPEKIKNIPNKVVFFPGSSIGNYEPSEAIKILKKFIQMVDFKGGLLIGVDLKKDKNIIELAYNDLNGITAEFNLNVLHRINKELNADLDVSNFYHKSFYNDVEGRIEMHLVSKKDQSFTIENNSFSFKEGETIHTENSYKYSIEEFKNLGFSAGYKEHFYWEDENNYFSLHYFSV